MKFFNPKEDVMDIELTQTGKRALAQGKFKPSFYLFFDDGVLYDLTAAGATSETQNNAEERIQEKTPKLKTQYNFSEVRGNVGFDSLESTVEKHFSLINALGTSDSLSTDSFPRWDVRMFGDDSPKITRAVEYLTSSYGILKIPQVDVAANFRTAVHHAEGDFLIKEDPNLSTTMQADGTYVAVQPRTILMQVLEEHSVFEKENFDIEVYIKDTETHLRDETGEDDFWTPLVFKKKVENIVDGILIDVPPEECKELDSKHVEYYFDIFVDNEIESSARSQIKDPLKGQNMYLSSTSPPIAESSFEMADIYSRVVPEDPCPDDECP
tara:strand:+ start:656 stop:1630 length:975 start_codon:yes stop_codon:yes gene_type:complete